MEHMYEFLLAVCSKQQRLRREDAYYATLSVYGVEASAADGRPLHFRSACRDGMSTATVDAVYTTPLLRRTGVIYAPIDVTSQLPAPLYPVEGHFPHLFCATL